MRTLCFYFQVHQPYRLKPYRFFDIGEDHHYWDDFSNRSIMRKVAQKCYLPMNALLLELINKYNGAFKVSFSISGTFMDQMEAYAPDVLESFQKLVATGHVELLNETFSHSLASLKSKSEFKDLVYKHQAKIKELFNGYTPKVFRNTELIYSDLIGALVAELGYDAMLTEGAKHILGWKSPNYIYLNSIEPKLKILLKNFQLSDDIAFRFGNKAWNDYPLTTDKFINWINAIPKEEETVNLFMDYETFGEHQWAETGIFDFMRHLPEAVFTKTNFGFSTPSEVISKIAPVGKIHVPIPISWADEERDLTAWLGNDLQDEAFDRLYDLEKLVNTIDDEEIQRDWRYLQTSDHFYYMCTKFFSDGDIHSYFSPYDSPYDAFINFMNVLSDFMIRLKEKTKNPIEV
ncbi:glycoside hydrolase family 57 protein [Algoriphagus sp. D3-2-R+10]|uniref:glycoside hydrolase family 57 protein n=1 Tax=Algoriphagus aurantiacus TaxID=3103948 RepID=UPI002B383C99|nr:glycoside hydrolase family 57 protein [Algoriphagus sp. D3-2-R+10]MEB2775712.1 glycoside hydrolase family 57 protein [Algoriphagus sp. D3-2-R+10]